MQPQSIGITINGESKQVPGDQSVSGLLQHLQVQADRVAVELNKTIVRRRDWERTAITEGSQLEIVEFVGGG
jgi:thiamine biosynthesis protein ThiS